MSLSTGSPRFWLLDIYLVQVLSVFFAWYLSQVGLSQVLSFFLLSIWAMSVRAMWSFFLLGTLSQTREVPADVVKTSRACFFSAFALNYFSEPCRLFFPVPLTL